MATERPPFLPPALGLLMMLGVFTAHFVRPVAMLFPFPLNYLALLPISLGVLLTVLADREFRRKGVVNENGQYLDNAGILVTSGIYGLTRNPSYLGLVLIIAGLAIWVGSLSPWLIVVLFVFLLRRTYIANEERRLSAQFGDRYRQYCRLVPRWLIRFSR